MKATRARLSGHSAGLRPRNRSGLGAAIVARARLEVVVRLLLLVYVVVIVVEVVGVILVFLVLEFVVVLGVERFFFLVVTVGAANRIRFPLHRAVVRGAAVLATRVQAIGFHWSSLTSIVDKAAAANLRQNRDGKLRTVPFHVNGKSMVRWNGRSKQETYGSDQRAGTG